MHLSVMRLFRSTAVHSLGEGSISAVNRAKCTHNWCSLVHYSKYSGRDDDDYNCDKQKRIEDPKQTPAPVSSSRVNPRLLGHKHLSHSLQNPENDLQTDLPRLRRKVDVKPKSSRQLLLSKQHSLLPASRVAAMLPSDFWQDPETQDMISSLSKSTELAESTADSTSTSEKDHLMEHEVAEACTPSTLGSRFTGTKSETLRGHDDQILTLNHFLKHIKRPVWTPSPKVISSMLHIIGVEPGQTVLEGGSGAGVAALMLSRLVGKRGFVYSVDHQRKCHEAARERYNEWCKIYKDKEGREWTNNISLHDCSLGNIAFLPEEVDVAFVDINHPVDVLEAMLSKLKYGGCLALYLRSVSHATDVLEHVHTSSLPLILEGVWEESNHSILVHLKQQSSEQFTYSLGAPRIEDKDTAFLAKFRKITRQKLSTSSVHGSIHSECEERPSKDQVTFSPGDQIVLNVVNQAKKRKFRKKLLTLVPGAKFINDWGLLLHDHAISKSPGSIVQTSTNQELYINKASILDWLREQGSEKKIQYNTRLYHLMSSVMDVSYGSKVLAVGCNITTLVMTILQQAGSQGLVHAVDHNPEEITETITALRDTKIVGADYGRNVQAFPMTGTVQHSFPTFDAMCLLFDDIDSVSLHEGYHRVRKGGIIAILCYRYDLLQSALDMLAGINDLRVDDVLVDREREWIVRRTQLDTEQDGRAPYICRPKQGIYPPTGFIIQVRKN